MISVGVVQILVLPAYLMYLYVHFIGSDSVHMTGFSQGRSMMRCISCQDCVDVHAIR